MTYRYSFKRTRYQEAPGAGALHEIATITVVDVREKGKDQLLGKGDLQGLSALMSESVVGARVHTDIRKAGYTHLRI